MAGVKSGIGTHSPLERPYPYGDAGIILQKQLKVQYKMQGFDESAHDILN